MLHSDWEEVHKAQAVLENQLAELCRIIDADTHSNCLSQAASIRLAMRKDVGKAGVEGPEEHQVLKEMLLHVLSEAAGIPASNFRLTKMRAQKLKWVEFGSKRPDSATEIINDSLATALEEKVILHQNICNNCILLRFLT